VVGEGNVLFPNSFPTVVGGGGLRDGKKFMVGWKTFMKKRD
jgi:hypothetical protein